MVPARLAQKMSVMSVGTSPPSAHRPIAVERVHRPGSRRLGGVEATGASPGVAASRPHRSGPRAGPVRRTPCARGAWGGERTGGLGLRLACRRELRGGAGIALRPVEVRLRPAVGSSPSAFEKKGYQIAPPAPPAIRVARQPSIYRQFTRPRAESEAEPIHRDPSQQIRSAGEPA